MLHSDTYRVIRAGSSMLRQWRYQSVPRQKFKNDQEKTKQRQVLDVLERFGGNTRKFRDEPILHPAYYHSRFKGKDIWR
jgi:hypothetical protein